MQDDRIPDRIASELVRQSVEHLEPLIPELSAQFYTHFFALAPEAERLFQGGHAFRQRKFANLFLTFRDMKHFDKLAPVLEKLGKRHRETYHGEVEAFLIPMGKALIHAVAVVGAEGFSSELRKAWEQVFEQVSTRMAADGGDHQRDRRAPAVSGWGSAERRRGWRARHDDGLLEAIGGAEVVAAVHKVFYQALFGDPWLGQFFFGKNEEVLARKQTEFMVSAFGGAHGYQGATPALAHMHMFVTEEQAELREHYLRKAILSQGLSEEVADRWLDVDRLFRPAVVKSSLEECVLVHFGQRAVVAKPPVNRHSGDDDPAVLRPDKPSC